MFTTDRAIVLLKLFLAALFGVLLLLQVMSLPGQFAYMAQESPDLAHLRWPLTALTVFWVFCAQVVVVATWRLLSLVRQDQIFSPGAFTWVNAIIGAVGAFWVTFGVFSLLLALNADDPGGPIFLFLLDLGVTVFLLLMFVMRRLLQQATAQRSDLEGVI